MMRDLILQKLDDIERKNNVRIILAVEVGSRAWGYASEDSDYDVRFIYVQPASQYLRLDKVRDVIECPVNEKFDINGWDLKKALQLLHQSNPSVFEWFDSPIAYKRTKESDAIDYILYDYYMDKHAIWHYINMAKRNYRDLLKDDVVKLKKYLYVLRAIFVAYSIPNTDEIPPIQFEELVESKCTILLEPIVWNLYWTKIKHPEIKTIEKINMLNGYIEKSIDELTRIAEEMPKDDVPKCDELNELFAKIVLGKLDWGGLVKYDN